MYSGSVRQRPARSRAAVGATIQSFEDFFLAEYPRLGKALYLLTSSRADSEDLAQEALTRVCERWHRVSIMDSPDGYLFRVAMNLFRRWVAASRRTMPLDSMDEAPSPGEDIADAELRVQILRALRKVTPEQRASLVLVAWLGFTTQEAGEILDIEAVSVRSRMHRARSVLRDEIGDW